jgi:hypothetical protein
MKLASFGRIYGVTDTPDRVYEWGVAPCVHCGKAHGYRDHPDKPRFRTWRALGDHHPYREMDAEQVIAAFKIKVDRDE